jgi:hypothetical protein
MKPKEKAKELTLKFMKIDSDSEQFDEFKMKFFYAQRCSLIAVDEIIQQCWDYRDIDLEKSHDYWQEVKQEIQAL